MPMPIPELRTPRLLLRAWREEDLAPFAEMNRDPAVMEHFPGLLSREESDDLASRIRIHFERNGFSFWAVEEEAAGFIGMVGLVATRYEAHFTPAIEIGWRLASSAWGHGYATEAALACLAFGFEELQREEIVSMTVARNHRSRRVMEKIGMHRSEADDFDHPLVEEGPLKRHVLYRLTRAGWSSSRRSSR
jgi:RimJ/RimL family protein N-acetyltransferase